jgi:hypothetical protein
LNKGLTRLLFFIVFLIPVGWYLFLQFFGDNTFTLSVKRSLDQDCIVSGVKILQNFDTLSIAESNHFTRVQYGANERKIEVLDQKSLIRNCTNQNDAKLVLIDESGIWGSYDLNREGVDLLLTELDILILQRNYGKDVSR